jgi:hypothetical protein
MAEKRKPPNAGKGRVKGVPNKTTADVRKAFSMLLEGSADQLQGWLRRVAVEDPARALELVAKFAEYHIPKLSRTELSTGSDTLKIEITDPTRRDNPAAK